MRIGQAAAAAGLEPSTVRFYEKAGVVPGPARTSSGYRDYSDDHVELLRFVRRLRELDLKLDDVREIVALRTAGAPPCRVVRSALTSEAADIERRIAELRRLRRELADLEARAAEVDDAWPGDCVCHVISDGG